MKASEVLKRYAAGERNFRGANLRGQSFKGKDLSGADFSEADIRSADFTGAILAGANFTGAKCELQKRWAIFLTILAWILAAISGFISIPVAANFFSRFDNFSNFNGLILNLVSLIVVITLSTIIIRQEIIMASAALAIGVVLTAAGIGVIPVGVATAIVGFIAGAISAAVAGAIGGFIALLSAVVGVVAGIAEVLEELGLETIAVAATLTGSCIEDWGITADTKLNSVKCDYIFTRLSPEKRPKWLTLSEAESLNPNPQRKPDNWKRDFEPREFEDFITPCWCI